MASAPQKISGPNSYQIFTGRVVSVKPVKLTIGTSDVSAEERDFLEVHLDIIKSDTFIISMLPDKNVSTSATSMPAQVNKIPTPETEYLRLVYVNRNEKIKVGDILECQTRDRISISRGWLSGSHLHSYKIISGAPSK